MSRVIIKNGEPTVEETGLMTDIVDAAMLPLGVFSQEEKYVSQKVAGAATIGFAAAGFVLGDRFGDKVPLIGQGRA